MKTETKRNSTTISLPERRIETVRLHVTGDTPLLMHNWSTENKESIKKKQSLAPTAKKGARNPQAEYEASFYGKSSDGYWFPSIAFKRAAVDACRCVENLTMVNARGSFYVSGEHVIIKGEPRMREDMVRIDRGGTADIRYRPEFPEWSCELTVRFNAKMISLAQILQLFSEAGFSQGVGDGRPNKAGMSFGMFHVESAEVVAS